MERAADSAEAAVVATATFRRQLKTFLFQSAYGHGETDCGCFVTRPRSPSDGRKTK